jgi:outer membrane lipoprotein-sorting protein
MNDDELIFRDRLNNLPFDDSCRQEHREQLREHVLAAFDESQIDPSPRRIPRPYSNWREIMRRPVPRLAAAVLIAASLCAVYLSFFSTHSTTAFAQMADPIIKAKTARFTVLLEGIDLPKQTFRTLVLEPGRLRQEMPTGEVRITDYNAGRMTILTPAQKSAQLSDIPKQQKSANFFDHLRTTVRAAKDDAHSKRESLGEKQIDGRKTMGFRLKTPDHETTIWGDPKTGLPILVEMTLALLPNTKITMTDFEFDVELDEALFAVKAPDGYSVVQVDVAATPIAEQDLIAALKMLSDHNQGRFPDTFDNGTIASFVTDWAARNNPVQPGSAQMNKLAGLSVALNRGMAFAVALPAESKARYAGKGITRDDKTAPVFWYQPVGTSSFRVIYADLSVKAQKAAPESPNAVPVNAGASVSERLRNSLKEQPRLPPPAEVAPPPIQVQPEKTPAPAP